MKLKPNLAIGDAGIVPSGGLEFHSQRESRNSLVQIVLN